MSIGFTYNESSGIAIPDGVDTTLVTLSPLTIGRKYFISWNAHIYCYDTSISARADFQIDGATDTRFRGYFRSAGSSSNFYGHGVFTPSTETFVRLVGQKFGTSNIVYSNFSRLFAIDLYKLTENNDYFFNEDATSKINIDNTYNNNLGAGITFTPDGISDYAVFAFGTIEGPSGTTKGSYGGMRVYDVSNSQQLCEMKRDVDSVTADSNLAYTFNGLWVLPTPSATPLTIRTEFIGANVWDYRYSNIFIARLNIFGPRYYGYEYNQQVSNTTYSDTAVHWLNDCSVSQIDAAAFARVACEAIDANQTWGIETGLNENGDKIDHNKTNLFGPATQSPGVSSVPDAIMHGQQYTGHIMGYNLWSQTLPLSATIRECALVLFKNSLYTEYQYPEVSNQDPEPDEIDVDINRPIKFRIASNIDSGVDIDTITVKIDQGTGYEFAIHYGVFQTGYNGSGSVISPIGDDSGYDVTIVPEDPLKTSQLISIRIYAQNNAQHMYMPQVNYSFTTSPYLLIYSFTIQTNQFSFPTEYSEELDLTSLPSGYIAQTSGTGFIPTFGIEGMTTIPNASGTSFIKKNVAGLDFETGVLFDVIASAGSTIGRTKVLRISKGEQGIVSVIIDFNNHEIWLNDTINVLPFDFRPSIKGTTVFFRLSIKGIQDNLIARLYSDIENNIEPYFLKQTDGPSTIIPVTGDSIDIGSIDSGDTPVIIKSFKSLLNEDPDIYYPFPQISNISPISDELSGGKIFRMEFENNIDLNAGSELLFSDNMINDESTGMANINVEKGILTLSTTGIGSSIARMLRSYSGDIPSGIDISVDFEVNADIISTPPQDEVILAAMELRSNGIILAIEMITDIINKTYFRALLINSDISVLNKKLVNTQKTNFTIRIIRAENQVKVFIDGINMINIFLKDGPGIIRFYNKVITDRSINTKISNFIVRPVVIIGNSIMNT